MPQSNNIALKVFSQAFNGKDIELVFNQLVSSISKETKKTEKEVIDQINNNLSFSKELQDKIISEFEKAEKSLGGKSFTFSKDLFKGIFDTNGIEEEINKVVKTFENNIESLINLKNRIGDDKVFFSMDTSQLDEAIKKEQQLIELIEKRNSLEKGDRSKTGITRNINNLEKELNSYISNLRSSSSNLSGQINIPTIDEKDLKLINKYSKDIDIVEKKLKNLNDAANEDDLTNAQNKDFIGYFQQYEKLMKESGQKINKEYQDFYNFLLEDSKLENFANHLKEILNLQEQITKGPVVDKAGVNTGIESEEVETIKNKISELENQISEMQTKLQNLDGEAFTKMQNDIGNLESRLSEANAQIINIQNNSNEIKNNSFEELKNNVDMLGNKLDEVNKKLQEFGSLSSNIGNQTGTQINGDKLSGKVFHGTKFKWNSDEFDFSKNKSGQLGNGAYFTADAEKVLNFAKADVKELEVNLDKCFILNKNYCSSVVDLYEAMGKEISEEMAKSISPEEAIGDVRRYNSSKENRDSFREKMLSKGYQGMYVGDYLANKIIPEELVIYDEKKLENLKSFTKNEFKELETVGNIEIKIDDSNIKELSDSVKDITQDVNVEGQNKLQSELKESNSEAENLLNTLNKIKSKMDFISNSSKLSDVLNFDVTKKFSNFNEQYKKAFTLLSEYKQTVLEINNLKLQPQTEEAQKKIEEFSLLAMRLGEQFQNVVHLNDSDRNSIIKQYGFSEEDFEIYSGGFIKIDKDALLDSLMKQYWDVFDELKDKFPDLYNDISENIKIDGNINPFSYITDEIERIKSVGKSTFDSINVDLMNSKDYVEDLRSALNRIVDSNNGKGRKDGLDGYYAIKNRPELEQFKDITTMLPEEEFNKFLSTLEKAQPYLDSIGYKVKEIKEDSADLSDQEKQNVPQQDSSSILSEQQALEKLEQAINSVTIAIVQKNNAIQAEEVQMDKSVNAEIAKLEELKSKLTEIKTQFESGIASGLFKDVDSNDITIPGEVDLSPKLSDTFKTDADNLLDPVNVEKEVNLKPTVDADKFKKDAEGILTFIDVNKEVDFKVGELDSKLTSDNPNLDNMFSESMFDNLIRDFDIKSKDVQNKIKLLVDSLSNISINEISSGIENNNFLSVLDELSKTIIENSNIVKQRTGIYDEFYNYLKGISSIKIPDIVRSDLGNDWNTLRQTYVSKFTTTKGIELDSIYQEMSSKFKDIFSGTADPTEQFREIVNAIKLYREDINNVVALTDSDIEEINQQIINRLGEMRNQIKSSLGISSDEDEFKRFEDNAKIELEPLIDQTSWEDEIDKIIKLIGTKTIEIKPDTTSQEWNDFKTFINNISNKVINLKVKTDENNTNNNITNRRSSLPLDLNTSYKNSEKYIKEIWSLEEKIAQAKENNSKKDLKLVSGYESRKNKLEELLKLEEQFRASDNFNNIDTSQFDDYLNKLQETQKQIYETNRSQSKALLESSIPEIEAEAWKENEIFDNNQKLKEANALLEQQREKWQEIQYIRVSMESEAGIGKSQDELDLLDDQKKALEAEKAIIDEQLKQYDSLIDKKKQSKELDKIESNANDVIIGTRVDDIDQAYKEANRLNSALLNTQKIMNNLNDGLGGKIFETAFKDANNYIKNLNNQLISSDITLSQYNSKINELKRDLSSQKTALAFVDINDAEDARNEIEKYINAVTKGTLENVKWNENTLKLTGTFINANDEIQKVTGSINRLSNGASTVNVELGNAQKQVSSFSKFIDELSVKFRNLATYLLSFVGFYEVWGAIRQGVTYVREFDTALTEMRKVSDETVESLKEFQEASFDIADSVGATAGVIQNSTAEWMRLGESLEQAAESAQVSNILLNVSEFESIDEATESLVAMSQAYDDVEKIDIVDKMNNIGNQYSIATDGIAQALQRSASSLTTAGNDLDEAIALVTAGEYIARNMWKHIFIEHI